MLPLSLSRASAFYDVSLLALGPLSRGKAAAVHFAPLLAGKQAVSLPANKFGVSGENPMSKKAAEHHKKASEHLTHAARHHTEAAKHHAAGDHEKAAHHAHTARAHAAHAREHSEGAAKIHLEEHGKK
jgi:hypothetical protein